MARVAFIADVHIANHRKCGGLTRFGINDRCAASVDALGKLVALADRFDALVICGDLFDVANPPAPVIASVQSALGAIAAKRPVIVLCGNHDQHSDQEGDNALAPLRVVDGVRVVERPVLHSVHGDLIACIPFRSGPAREWFADAVETLVPSLSGEVLLAFHLGVADDETPVYLRGAHDSLPCSAVVDVCKQHGIQAAFAGNWHTPRIWEEDGSPTVVQCGAFVPTGWDNAGAHYGFVTIWDTASGTYEAVAIPGPRFLDVGAAYARAEYKPTDYVRIHLSSQDDVRAALAWLELRKCAGGEVVVEDGDAEGAASAARDAVQHAAGGFDAAVREYVANMRLDDGVSREAVQSIVSEALS